MTLLDLGEHQPDAATGPQRSTTGAQRPPRALTSHEQHGAAVAWMLGQATKRADDSIEEVAATITWGDRSQTHLTLGVAWESTHDGRIATLAYQREYDQLGAEVRVDGERWVQTVRRELTGGRQ